MKTNAPTLTIGQWKDRSQEKVVAAWPRRHEVSGRFMDSFEALRQYDLMTSRRIADGGGLISVPTSQVTNGRNEIVRGFLEHETADWLWFIDTDMTFDPDTVDRLVEAAHPKHRPIMGALCFSLQGAYRAVPTLYVIRPDGQVGNVYDYPTDTLMATMTGTGCLLIHRTVFEKMRDAVNDDGALRFPKPYEWFRDSQFGDRPVGEDITFCVRALTLDIPVHVHTAIKCGHEKPFIVDEEFYLAQKQAGMRDPADVVYPTFVVIAAKNRHEMTYNLLGQLDENAEVMLYDNGSDPPLILEDDSPLSFVVDAEGWPLHRMWNHALDAIEKVVVGGGLDKWNVAILNNDLEVPPGFLARLEGGLRANDDNWISYPNWHGADIPDRASVATKGSSGDGRSLSGWAFMVRGESGLRFDEQFEWWYGDADIQKQTEAAGKHVVCVGGCYCNHLHPNESTQSDPERIAQAIGDEARFAAKWDLDPATLILAKNRVTV